MSPPRGIGYEIKSLSLLIGRYLRERLDKRDLGSVTGIQGMIIGYLYDNANEHEIFQRDIEREFHIRRSTVTGILKSMEASGLVTRESVDYDARLKRLRLTPKAITIHRIVIEELNQVEDKLRTGLSDDEIEIFLRIIDRMKQNIG